MHTQVIEFLRAQVREHGLDLDPIRVLDIGGAQVSTKRFYTGPQPRELFHPETEYLVLDINPGPDVDIVADATQSHLIPWEDIGYVDVVVCTGTLEHVKNWIPLLAVAREALRTGGRLILTCAGPGFRPHPATTEDWEPAPGEYYGNVGHMDVRKALEYLGFRDILTWQAGQETQATAVR